MAGLRLHARMHGTERVALLSLVVSVIGCSTSIALTDAGSRVQHIPRTEIPAGCRLVGDVAIGIPPDAATPRTEEELSILMRNKAGQEGRVTLTGVPSRAAGCKR